jgi:Protein of unknown function (DUF1631)
MQSQEHHKLLADVRQKFVVALCEPLNEVSAAGVAHLLKLTEEFGTPQQSQQRMASFLEFRRMKDTWVKATRKKLHDLLAEENKRSEKKASAPEESSLRLELQDSLIVERKIHTARITTSFQDAISSELSDIRLRLRTLLENGEFSKREVLDPKVLSEQWVQAWEDSGGATIVWEMVYKAMSDAYLPSMVKAYREVNKALEAAGLKAEIGLHTVRMRAYSYAPVSQQSATQRAPAAPFADQHPRHPSEINLPTQFSTTGQNGVLPAFNPHPYPAAEFPQLPELPQIPDISPPPSTSSTPATHHAPVWGHPATTPNVTLTAYGQTRSAPPGSPPPALQGVHKESLVERAMHIRNEASAAAQARSGTDPAEDTDPGFMNFFASTATYDRNDPSHGTSPTAQVSRSESAFVSAASHASGISAGAPAIATAHAPALDEKPRSQHVVGQLMQMLRQRVGLQTAAEAISSGAGTGSALGSTDTLRSTAIATVVDPSSNLSIPENATPAQAAGLLRERTDSLKRKASTQGEKATIEIVALMFQSILTEERIPSAVRVLFARLQMPVVRVALAEPEFFDHLEHPARKLIDRMGSCVLGLDSSAVSDDALVREISRIVQTIEQYPDTGRRVFKLVLDEFEKFLQSHLGRSENSRKLMGVAQQVELRETLSIQYTIEIRNLIKDVAINEKVREFLLKTWSEVLAVSAVRHGKNSAKTKVFKDGTTRLIWAAGAKHLRADRMKLIAEMPSLMQLLRDGLEAINLESSKAQELVDMLARSLGDTFKVRTQAIDAEQLNAISDRLQNLEEFFSNDDLGDLPLKPEDLELMLDIDVQGLNIILKTPITPSEAAKHWANEIELGKWFVLEHEGLRTTVQYVWCSDMRQLHLLASSDGRSYLMQAQALAAYLEMQRLSPLEEEALSVRATREALDKITAKPETLLG